MKKKKYLPLYYEWMKSGSISDNGLCWCFGSLRNDVWIPRPGFENFKLMFPDSSEKKYWASDDGGNCFWGDVPFGPTRQNIVLFLAAMNNEL